MADRAGYTPIPRQGLRPRRSSCSAIATAQRDPYFLNESPDPTITSVAGSGPAGGCSVRLESNDFALQLNGLMGAMNSLRDTFQSLRDAFQFLRDTFKHLRNVFRFPHKSSRSEQDSVSQEWTCSECAVKDLENNFIGHEGDRSSGEYKPIILDEKLFYRLISENRKQTKTKTDDANITSTERNTREANIIEDEVPNDHPHDQTLIYRQILDQYNNHLETRIQVNAQSLCHLLRDILTQSRTKEYEEFMAPTMNFKSPYIMLFQDRKRLMQSADDTRIRPDERQLLARLLDLVKKERPRTWAKLDDIDHKRCETISFEDSWLLYPPHSTVLRKNNGAWEAFKVENVRVEGSPQPAVVHVDCYYLNKTDKGSKLQQVPISLSMTSFYGDRRIRDLSIIPESHVPAGVIERLKKRGNTFFELCRKPAFREYVGDVWPTAQPCEPIKIMIDYVTPSGRTADPCSENPNNRHDCPACIQKYCGLSCYSTDQNSSVNTGVMCVHDRWGSPRDNVDFRPRVDPLLYCPPKAWANSLSHETWQQVDVERLAEVKADDVPFNDCLVMGKEYKNMVESMVDRYKSGIVCRDVVPNKGEGMVVLIHGAPGTGKTLTVGASSHEKISQKSGGSEHVGVKTNSILNKPTESIAVMKGLPLYALTCAKLGTSASELERSLKAVFLKAVNWGAILLLDEADVFMQERDMINVERSALVSVFLSGIESYRGLLFLTTSRAGQIDMAFRSRMVILGVPDPDFGMQLDIWRVLIREHPWLDVDKKKNKRLKRELFEFAKALKPRYGDQGPNMNGREIGKCLKLAQTLADGERKVLSGDHLRRAIGPEEKHDKYLLKVNHVNQCEKTKQLGLSFGQA